MSLVKFIVSTNTSLNQLKNQELVNCLKIDTFDPETFSKVIVPNVLKEVYKVLNEMLVDADNITLISDIWSSRTLYDFMGVDVSTINDNFVGEISVIGMTLTPGNHCAEMIKKAIEKVVNRFDFDSSKLIGKYSLYYINFFYIYFKLYLISIFTVKNCKYLLTIKKYVQRSVFKR